MSRLHVFYRSTGPDRFPRRPPYFDKLLCLKSFLRSFRHVAHAAEITFVNDGPVPEDRVALMARWGNVVSLPGIGNGPSFRHCAALAAALPEDAVAYLCEDDYLHLEPALTKLVEVFDTVPEADYVTLYDHLDRYTRRDDAGGGLARIVLAAGRHWRTVDSTCLTFGVRPARIRSDQWIVRACTMKKGRPADHLMWHVIQGRKLFAWKFPKRLLLGAVPSLATHMDTRALAPTIDWDAAAAEATRELLD